MKIGIIGAGVVGCTCAYFLNKKGYNTTVFEAGNQIGGGVWTNFYAGHPYTFGPRMFFSKDEQIIKFMNDLCPMKQITNYTSTFSEEDSQFFNYPLYRPEFEKMNYCANIVSELNDLPEKPHIENFENYWTSVIGPTLYKKFIDKYSKKMWQIDDNKKLSANWNWVNKGTPIRDTDRRIYKDMYTAYPKAQDGFNEYFRIMLKGSNVIKNVIVTKINNRNGKYYFVTRATQQEDYADEYVMMNLDFEKKYIFTQWENELFDVVINTAPLDMLFDYKYGMLHFAGRELIPFILPVKNVFPKEVFWSHYAGNESYSRITEFKKFTRHQSSHTLLVMEIPTMRNRLYPLENKENMDLFNKYKNELPKNIYTLGRNGGFHYNNIPEAIRESINLCKKI
jgi:UDP-galactopyranose mutase